MSPAFPDDVNHEGCEVPTSFPLIEFFHWLFLDIPVATRQIAAGSYGDGVTARGKKGPEAPDGLRQGVNDFTGWFANDPNMKGTYFGYDGPAPPWNDSVVHHYTFTLYAVDVAKLEVKPTCWTSCLLPSCAVLMRRHSRLSVEVCVVLATGRSNGTNALREAATVYKVDPDAIALKVKQELAANAKAKKEAKPTPSGAVKSGKAA